MRSLEADLDGVEPDLVMVFLSHHHAAHLSTTAAYLLRRFDGAVLTAVTGAGVIGGGVEVEGEPAVSIVAAVLPDVELRPFHVSAAEVQYLSTHPEHWYHKLGIPKEVQPSLALFPEPFSCDADKLCRSLDAAWPEATVIGGLASGARHPGQNKLLVHRVVHDRGAIGVAMWGNVALEPIVSSGSEALGRPLVVTRSAGALALELDGRPALSMLERLVGGLDAARREGFVSAPVVGIERADSPGGAVIRNVMSIDRDSLGVEVALPLRVGDRLSFHLRDRHTAHAQLKRMLTAASPAAGALVISCVARGRDFFGVENHDTQIIQRAKPQMPFGGFFGNGELGPVGGRTWTHGYTNVLGLFRPVE